MAQKNDCGKCDTAEMMVELKKRGYVVMETEHYNRLSKLRSTRGVSEMDELCEDDKPSCFGCYGYRTCVNRTTPPSSCPWESRCYNSQRDS